MNLRFHRMGPCFRLALAALWLVIPVLCFSQQLAKRLILKDGSYQLTTRWEIKGDRVRYLSAERDEWEEVPNALVDWAATEQYEKDRASGAASPEAREIDKELEAERKAEEANSPQVAPGLNLPGEGGTFLLDTFNGQPQLVEIQQNGGEINRNLAGNILRGAINPVGSAKQDIELKGMHARVQAHGLRPVLYVNPQEGASGTTAQTAPAEASLEPQNRYRIVRAEIKKDVRVVGNIKIAIYGKVSQEGKFLEAKVEPVSGGWVKVTPLADLAPGEYALVEMLGTEGMNLYVWDFGVNPSAPANASAWKPVPPKLPPGDGKTPELEKRKLPPSERDVPPSAR
jgi:hypothetical protein